MDTIAGLARTLELGGARRLTKTYQLALDFARVDPARADLLQVFRLKVIERVGHGRGGEDCGRAEYKPPWSKSSDGVGSSARPLGPSCQVCLRHIVTAEEANPEHSARFLD